MAGWPDLENDGDSDAADIKAQTKSIKADLKNWRDQIAAGSTGGLVAAERYQALASYRNFMTAKIGANANGIAQAFIRRNPNLAGFDPAARWAEVKTEIDSFLQWFQTNWPKKAGTGEPAFREFDPVTLELRDQTIAFGPAAKTQLLARLDAVIAALPAA